MSKVFKDKFQMECSFGTEGVSFCNSKRDIYFPYGCIDSLNLSFLGVLQAVSRGHVCCFTVGREDKAEIKDLVKKAKEAMKSAPIAEPVVVELEQLGLGTGLSAEEQMKQYKAMYVQGVLSREQFDFMKRKLA